MQEGWNEERGSILDRIYRKRPQYTLYSNLLPILSSLEEIKVALSDKESSKCNYPYFRIIQITPETKVAKFQLKRRNELAHILAVET